MFPLECREKDPQRGVAPQNLLSSHLRGCWGTLQAPSPGERSLRAAPHFIFPPRTYEVRDL